METTYVASCSFGKDSIAMLDVIYKNNLPLDYIIFVEPMYTSKISGLHPKQKEFVGYAKARIKKLYGYNVIFLHPDISYKDQFYKTKKKGKHVGDIYGFPCMMSAWCNDRLKMRPIKKFLKKFKSVHEYIGIAYDEHKRHERILNNKDKSAPLYDYKITEAMAMDICNSLDLVSPVYSTESKRDGCWFCHNTRLNGLRKLRVEYPNLWNELLSLEKDSHTKFKHPHGVFKLDERFKKEEQQLKLEF